MSDTRNVLTGGKTPRIRKARKNDWTEAKQGRFFAALADTCNIAAALRRVRKSESSYYRLKRRSAAFRAGIAAAIGEAHQKLHLELLDRSINGTVKTVIRSDGRTETIREYPNAVALALLRMHKGTAEAASTVHEPEDVEAVRERIMKKLAIVRRRLEAGDQ